MHDVDAVTHLTNASTIAMVLGLIFIVPVLLKYFPKRVIYQLSILITSAAYLLSCVAPESLTLLIVMNALKGLAMGASSSMLYAVSADAVDWGEFRTGIRTAGLGTALVQCIGKFGIGIGTGLMGIILSTGGYVANTAVQSSGELRALIAVYTWIPGLILILSLTLMTAYDLDRVYPEVAKTLKERRSKPADATEKLTADRLNQ